MFAAERVIGGGRAILERAREECFGGCVGG